MTSKSSRGNQLLLIIVGLAGCALLTWVAFQLLFPFWVTDAAFDRLARDFTNAGMNPLLVKGIAVLVLVPFFVAVTEVVRLGIWARLRGAITGRDGGFKWRRRAALATIVIYASAYFLALYVATRGHNFAADGTPRKWCAETPEGLRCFDAPGVDPVYGLTLQAVDSATVVLEERARRGQVPQRIPTTAMAEIEFFDRLTQRPRVWYYQHPSGEIQLFSSSGSHPTYGVSLQPITPEIVARLEQQQADARRRADDEAAERQRSAAAAAEAALRARRNEEVSRLVNRNEAMAGPAVVAVDDSGSLMPELADRLARELGGSSSYFKALFASGGAFARAFGGDPTPLRALDVPTTIPSVVLVRLTSQVGAAGVLDKDLLRAQIQLTARIFRPSSGFASSIATARGVAADFSREEALAKALASAERELLARIRN
ncbi:MAG TPA: hypothetical protein VM364_03325 [Vicinamibacterales bacterium]|nr:hypothetical protein [Vicinamibacterales bacterium]